MKKLTIVLLSAFLFFPACLSNQNSATEEKFKKSFPNNKYDSITPTSIKGVYEVYRDSQIYYYMPEGDVILTGSIITKDGNNLINEGNAARLISKMAKLPLDEAALKIGNGKITVVEFMDVNCNHCRQAYNFFSQRKDVTHYLFFYPLSPDSDKKIRHILCAKDKLQTYDDVMTGKLDKKGKLNICADKKVDEIIKTQMRHVSQTGIAGTPLFYINGQVVDGFDADEIEKLLND